MKKPGNAGGAKARQEGGCVEAEFTRKLLAEFNKTASQWRARLAMKGPEPIEHDEEVRRQLRALGYIN